MAKILSGIYIKREFLKTRDEKKVIGRFDSPETQLSNDIYIMSCENRVRLPPGKTPDVDLKLGTIILHGPRFVTRIPPVF